MHVRARVHMERWNQENQSRGNNGKQVALKASDAIVIYCLGPDVFNLSSYKLG